MCVSSIKLTFMKPILRYFGGKALIAKKIVALMPSHEIYLEPYAGAATVLLNKFPAQTEIYNDLDNCVFSFFNVLRNKELTHKLIENLLLTPFSRQEFHAAYEPSDDPVESARRMVVRSYQGYFPVSTTYGKTGFRVDLSGSSITTWQTIHKRLLFASCRLRNVVVENKPAMELVNLLHKNEKALIYIDPPYLMSTVYASLKSFDEVNQYKHMMTDNDHIILLKKLNNAKAKIMISGFDSPIYEFYLKNWTKHIFAGENRLHKSQQDCLWTNF